MEDVTNTSFLLPIYFVYAVEIFLLLATVVYAHTFTTVFREVNFNNYAFSKEFQRALLYRNLQLLIAAFMYHTIGYVLQRTVVFLYQNSVLETTGRMVYKKIVS